MKAKIFITVFTAFVLFFVGCKKEEQPQPIEQPVQTEQPATPPAPVDTVAAEPEVVFPDVTGTWTGTFDSRPTTLKIASQEGDEFKGSITINYREVINQQVSGKINPETGAVSMKDLLHSRYAGTYSAKLSEDGKKLSGTFTETVDKRKATFTLKKK